MPEERQFACLLAALKEIGLTPEQVRGVRELTGNPDGWVADVLDRAEELNAEQADACGDEVTYYL